MAIVAATLSALCSGSVPHYPWRGAEVEPRERKGLTMYGLPSLQTIMLIATVPILLAFAIVNYKQNVFSISTFFVIVANDWYVIWFYMAYMYADWKITEGKEPERKITSDAMGSMPQVRGYAHETKGIKIDKIRLFNRALIDMRNSNFEVDMTEAFWVVEKVADESRWNRIGGLGRTDFVDVLERGILYGAYKKVGGQGKRVPNDWKLIRALEQGLPLPEMQDMLSAAGKSPLK